MKMIHNYIFCASCLFALLVNIVSDKKPDAASQF